MIRFERLGKHDYAVYVKGEQDAIGKAGKLCDDCWFVARASLGGGMAWEKTMLDAVKAWAATQLRNARLKRLIEREMFVAAISQGQHPEWYRGYEDEN